MGIEDIIFIDEETLKNIGKIISRGNTLVTEAIGKLCGKSSYTVTDFAKDIMEIEEYDGERIRLYKIIDARDHDIACLDSELRQALDENAGLKNEIDELKRKLH